MGTPNALKIGIIMILTRPMVIDFLYTAVPWYHMIHSQFGKTHHLDHHDPPGSINHVPYQLLDCSAAATHSRQLFDGYFCWAIEKFRPFGMAEYYCHQL